MAIYEVDAQIKQKIITLISSLIPEARIYLFGSRARATNTQWSDIDLALDADKKIERSRIAEMLDILAATDIPYEVDIVDLHDVNADLKTIIEKEKVVWGNFKNILTKTAPENI